MIPFVIELILCLIASLIFALNIYNLKIINVNIKETFQIAIMTCFFLTLCELFFKIFSLPLMVAIIFTFFSIKKKDKIKTIIVIILSYLIYSSIDTFLGMFILRLLNTDATYFQSNFFLRIFLIIINLIFNFIVSAVIGILVVKFNFHKVKIEKKSKLTILTIIIMILGCTMVYVNAMINKFMNTSMTVTLFNAALFVIYLISTIIAICFYGLNLKKEIEFENRKKEFTQLKEYTEILEQMYNDMRKFKHDYVNILSTINGYIENTNMEQLEEYFNKNILPLSNSISSKNTKLGLLQHIKVIGLKGLLSSKIINAHSLEIDTFIDITEDIDRIDMDIVYLCRIIGILFDNAIEAAVLSTEHKIQFGTIKRNYSVTIVIINSCSEDIPPVYKLFKKGFSTKGENRGMGLSIVKEIIDKTINVTLNTSIDKGMFKQELNIRFKEI